ncbi:hypothetical protein ACSSWA_03175 [Melioribacter sp. Ez-97]|uniref:hypothetical protein n=1 Tax=Melioribacter sp. Ez-97 TaxID=3423434 RepID=UPI003EDA263A
MPDLNKYDMFLEELGSLEKEIYYFLQKGQELVEANKLLNEKINLLERENSELKKKISDIESKLSKISENESHLIVSGNKEEREALKNKISELIERIDYHLRS